jgi:hypothetical protein
VVTIKICAGGSSAVVTLQIMLKLRAINEGSASRGQRALGHLLKVLGSPSSILLAHGSVTVGSDAGESI